MAKREFACDCDAIHHQAVDAVRQAMPEGDLLSRTAQFYKIMGDETRCKLLFALQQRELCVCDLASLLEMTKSAVSHQLGKMRESGIVKCRREGKEVYYSLDDHHIAEVFAITMAHIQHKQGEETA